MGKPTSKLMKAGTAAEELLANPRVGNHLKTRLVELLLQFEMAREKYNHERADRRFQEKMLRLQNDSTVTQLIERAKEELKNATP
jgi:predicted metal-dependent peptidase